MCTGLHLKQPIPEKREAYLGWLIIACFVNVSIVNSWVVEFTVPAPVHTVELALGCMESTLLVKLGVILPICVDGTME